MEVTSKIRIRPYTCSDYPYLSLIHDEARKIELAASNLSPAFLPLTIAAESEGLFEYTIYIAEYDNIPSGFIAVTDNEIAWLYVNINYFRHGIVSALVKHAIQKMHAEISLEVLIGNSSAIAFYTSLGFIIKETLSGKMSGNEDFAATAHVMTLENC